MILFLILTWLFIGLILYVYIGYPLVLWLMGKVRARPVDKAPITPSVTLLIPTYNEEDVIRRKLENSIALDYPREQLEILVIDDASDDATTDIVREYHGRGVTLVRKRERSGKMSSLEIGFERASGEIVVLSDASPSYEPKSLKSLLQPFHDPDVGVAVGRLAVWDSENSVAKPAGFYWKYEAAIRRLESSVGSTVAVHGNMYAIRRKLFKRLAAGTINDEWSITMRVIQQGYRIIYEPSAVSYDDVSKKMKDEFQRRVRISAGRYQAFFSSQKLWPWKSPLVVFQIISHKLFRLLLPLFMIGALLCNVVAVFFGSAPAIMWVLLFGQAGFYCLALLGYRAERADKPKHYNPATKSANLAYYITSSNIASLYGYMRYLRGQQSVLWEKADKEVVTTDPF